MSINDDILTALSLEEFGGIHSTMTVQEAPAPDPVETYVQLPGEPGSKITEAALLEKLADNTAQILTIDNGEAWIRDTDVVVQQLMTAESIDHAGAVAIDGALGGIFEGNVNPKEFTQDPSKAGLPELKRAVVTQAITQRESVLLALEGLLSKEHQEMDAMVDHLLLNYIPTITQLLETLQTTCAPLIPLVTTSKKNRFFYYEKGEGDVPEEERTRVFDLTSLSFARLKNFYFNEPLTPELEQLRTWARELYTLDQVETLRDFFRSSAVQRHDGLLKGFVRDIILNPRERSRTPDECAGRNIVELLKTYGSGELILPLEAVRLDLLAFRNQYHAAVAKFKAEGVRLPGELCPENPCFYYYSHVVQVTHLFLTTLTTYLSISTAILAWVGNSLKD